MKNKNVISIAKKKDARDIMKFIRSEWDKKHILALNRKFFLYEYGNNSLVNFVISKINNKINGIQGFLKSSSSKKATLWATMWCTSKKNVPPMLGISMLNYMRSLKYKSVMSNGINESSKKIYKLLGFKVGILNHHFIPNNDFNNCKIAKIPKYILKKKNKIKMNNKLTFKKINLKDIYQKFNFNKYNSRVPFKDYNYFKKRFFKHPVYVYDTYGVFNEEKLLSILVTRVNKFKKSTCLRIVDFYGEENTLNTFTYYLVSIMKSYKHEYIDILSLGLSEKILSKAGFIKINKKRKNIIIPNYFEPFIRRNVDIKYFTDLKNLKNLRIFKSDGDQDRPNFFKFT